MADSDKTVAVSLQLLYDPRSSAAFKAISAELDRVAKKAQEALSPVAGKGFRKEYRDASGQLIGAANYATQAGLSARNIQDRRQQDRFAERQDYLGERAGIASQLGFGTAGGVMGRVGSFASGLQGAGLTGAAGLAQRAALPLAVAAQGMAVGGRLADYRNDQYSTGEQKLRGMVRDFVPGGESIQRFTDSMSGRSARMEQNAIDQQLRQASLHGNQQASAFAMQFNPRQAVAEGLAGAYRSQSAVAPSVFDRSGYAGEKAYREEQKILPLKQAEAKAERDAAAASKERVSSQEELNKLNTQAARQARELAQMERKLGGSTSFARPSDALGYLIGNGTTYTSGPDRDALLRQIQDKRAALTGTEEQKQEAARLMREAGGREVGAKTEAERARNRTRMLGEASILESRADTAQGIARSLGGMSPWERRINTNYALEIKARGTTEGLPQHIIAGGIAAGGEEIAKIHEGAILKGREYGDLNAALGLGNPNDLRGQADKLRRDEAVKGFALDAGESEAIAGLGREFGKAVVESMKAVVAQAKKEIMDAVLRTRGRD